VLFLFVKDSRSFQNSIFYLVHYQREALSLSVLFKHYFVWHFPRSPFAQLNMGLYLLPSDLEPCGRTHCNFSEHFSWNGKCTVQLLHHLSSIRPRFKSAQCSTSLFGQRHVRHHCLIQCIAQLFSYIGMQKFEHCSISLTDFPGKCNSWPTFPTLPTVSHCVVMVSLYVMYDPVAKHSRRCLQKPSLSKALLRVHVGAKANVHYPRSCIVQDALFSVSEKLGSVCVSFETESQYAFLYRHSTDFGTCVSNGIL
jgi:hypothetical protein